MQLSTVSIYNLDSHCELFNFGKCTIKVFCLTQNEEQKRRKGGKNIKTKEMNSQLNLTKLPQSLLIPFSIDITAFFYFDFENLLFSIEI